MKKLSIIIFFCTALLTIALAQTPPNAFNYSAVARNAEGQPIATTTIGIQVTILINSATGISQYSENHFVNTDAFGLFNLIIGAGAVQSGSMSSIDWSNDNYYLKVGMDASGGTNFITMGTTQLLSVPYAIYARSAGSLSEGGNEVDPVFAVSVASGITSSDTSNWNNKQDQLVAGSNITIAGNVINSNFPNTGFTHFIGEEFGGGVIFHLWKDALSNEHGLIIDKTDLSVSQNWGNIDTVLIGITAQSSWDGLSNSLSIVSQPGHIISAASLCLNSINGGQNDWYLPSIDELNLLWQNRFNINKTMASISGAIELSSTVYFLPGVPFQLSNSYISSTEANEDFSYKFDFTAGKTVVDLKAGTSDFIHVRAIRKF